ncbi:MAG: response regulator transcription factor [Lachnospiraceae bacterium]|nr:response regulator transcription factor [Lachnospiraceae bacterium]
MKILLAEDETDLSEVIKAMLEHSSYNVDAVENGALAVEHARSNAYDLIILDIMMPVMTGLEAVKEIRTHGILTPVLFLSAKAEVDDRINGLDAGADDYLTKPFAMGELLARVRAMTRRRADYTPRVITLHEVSLDMEKAELSCKNTISLAAKEIRLMELFMNNPDLEFTTEDLLERFWHGENADSDAVWMYISFLRNKLKSVGAPLAIIGEEGGSYCLRKASLI